MVAVIIAGLPAGFAPSKAGAAATTPSAKERKAITKAALKDCRKHDIPQFCRADRFQTAISGRNPRFAYGGVSGDHYSGPFLRRAKGSKVWKPIFRIGGGIPGCADVNAAMPNAVVEDFRIRGLMPGTGSEAPCWTDACPTGTYIDGGLSGATVALTATGIGCDEALDLVLAFADTVPANAAFTNRATFSLGNFTCTASSRLVDIAVNDTSADCRDAQRRFVIGYGT